MYQKKVSIIIVSYNVHDFLGLCLDAVMKAVEGIDAEVFVVDNNSSDDSCDLVRDRFKKVILIENKDNRGFSKANNQAVAMAKGEYIHFLNPDTVIPEDFYSRSIPFLDNQPTVGSLGPRIIDGLGNYAPDSKKSFPSFWVSVYKVTGLSRLFQHSGKLNSYYAANVQENQTAEVDILSGCCLLVRHAAMMQSGGSFDEEYFMYCEDVDLCHRLKINGFKNFYFPEVTIIHYKGESTRKLSFKYMETFYNALSIFVKKYYPRTLGKIYISSLRVILAIRNFFYLGKYLFSIFKLFLLDAVLLTGITIGIKNFWFDVIAQIPLGDATVFVQTIPVFILIWLSSLFLNGAYEKPFSLFKAGRGMVVGTLIVLAWYSLFPQSYRYSRGVVLFSGMTNTVALLSVRWILAGLKLIPLVPRGKMNFKAAIVSHVENYGRIKNDMEKNMLQASIYGRVAVNNDSPDPDTLGEQSNLNNIQQAYEINEFIFDSASLSYKNIIHLMESCRSRCFYKIQTPFNGALIGDHYGKNIMDVFLLNQRFTIGTQSAKRNKRLLDFTLSLAFLFAYPILNFKIKNKKGFRHSIIQVLKGKKTWIGYNKHIAEECQLPVLKTPVAPPYKILPHYTPDHFNQKRLMEAYATHYSALDDLKFIMVNFRWLGN